MPTIFPGAQSAIPASRSRGAYAKSAARKAQIVEVATTVFTANGYTGGSFREIADQIGVSLTSLVHHFPHKIELLEAVLTRANEIYGITFDEICREHGLRAAVLDLAKGNLGHPELLRLLAVLSAECSRPHHPGHPWFAERYANIRSDHVRWIIQDQGLGRIPKNHDPIVLADLIIAIWDGLQLQWLIDPHQDMLGKMASFFDSIGMLGP